LSNSPIGFCSGPQRGLQLDREHSVSHDVKLAATTIDNLNWLLRSRLGVGQFASRNRTNDRS
jgi:hypothetical protein